MRIEYIKSSCVLVESGGKKVLCDPWLTDGAYYGSWAQEYPPYELDQSRFDDVDYIYISHIHPDHLDPNTLSKLKKDIPIIIHEFQAKFLKMKIERMGFEVIELPHGKEFSICDQFKLSIFAADGCDPTLCGKFFGCNLTTRKDNSTQIDTLSVFSDSKHTVVNTNDSPIELARPKVLPEIKSRYGKIDFLMHGYTNASPYPQCTVSLTEEEMLLEADRVMKLNYERCMGYIRELSPRYYMPFAGRYLLSGKLSKSNYLRANFPPTHAKQYLSKHYADELGGKKCVLLNSHESFDLKNATASREYIAPDPEKVQEYIEKVLSKATFSYECDDLPSRDDLYSLLEESYRRMEDKRAKMGFSTDTDVYIKLAEGEYALISMQGGGIQIVGYDRVRDSLKYVILDLDTRLLHKILKGPRYAHWNNADIGSHIKYTKHPNLYERGIYHTLCFFHS